MKELGPVVSYNKDGRPFIKFFYLESFLPSSVRFNNTCVCIHAHMHMRATSSLHNAAFIVTILVGKHVYDDVSK